MKTVEIEELERFQERVHQTYGAWAPEHADGTVLTAAEYDPHDYYQRVDIPHFKAKPDLKLAERIGRIGMGQAGFEHLSKSLIEKNVLEGAITRHSRRQSSLVATLHLRDVFDTAMTHNNVFVTSGGDKEVAEINDIIASPMMSRLKLGEWTVMKVLTSSGGVDVALPPEGAIKHGMSSDDAERLERMHGAALKKRLAQGVLAHWALPSGRGVAIDEEIIAVKRVKDGIANIVRKRAPWAVPIPMDVKFGNCKAEVLNPRMLEDVKDVHHMMEEMAEAACDLTGKKIIYGLPGEKPVRPKTSRKN